MTVTLINTFVVPRETVDGFVDTWRSTLDQFTSAPGFIDAQLHRNTGLHDATFQYVNVAHWRSVEEYRAALSRFRPAAGMVGVVAYPGLFDVVAEIGDAPSRPGD